MIYLLYVYIINYIFYKTKFVIIFNNKNKKFLIFLIYKKII